MNKENKKIKCGLIMPISSIDGCTKEHWLDVKSILLESLGSIEEFDVETSLVSDADEVGIIQKRIVQNIYSSDIVICDVSAKNPNVMFELGLRLAFDKPTIIIKDELTNYSFDTSIIEHLIYPRDLRFTKIVEFKKKLCEKLIATIKAYEKNPEHSTFLNNFGEFKIVNLKSKEVTADTLILERLEEMNMEIRRLRVENRNNKVNVNKNPFMIAEKLLQNLIAEVGETKSEEILINGTFYEHLLDNMNPKLYFNSENEFKEFYNNFISRKIYVGGNSIA